MTCAPERDVCREAGYALVALLAAITVMMIAMAAALPSWRYVMKNEREEELLFRGEQIAKGIERCQAKMKIVPTSIDMLLKNKCLRKAYKDPMTADGKWRLLPPGGVLPAQGAGQGTRPLGSASPSPSPTPAISGSRLGGSGGNAIGPFTGVVSRSKEKSLRLFVGPGQGPGDEYDKWFFIAGTQFTIGKSQIPNLGGPPRPGQSPQNPTTPPDSTPK
jgi:type II secretory pathway pseudopilin PulG